MIDGWQPKEDSVHLRFGQEYHTSIERYHKARVAGASHKAAMRDAVREALHRTKDWEVDLDTKAGKYKNRGILVELVIDYLDHIKDDPAQIYVQENGKAAVELSFRFELDWGPEAGGYYNPSPPTVYKGEVAGPIGQPYLLCGHLDQIVTFADSLFVMDHKTATATLTDHYFEQYAPNNQMTLYTLASKIVINSPVKGVIIDAAQILLEKPHAFKRGLTYRTAEQLDEWVGDLQYWLTQAEAYAVANYWPMNDTACDKFGGCKFRQVCSKSPATRHVYLKSSFTQVPKEERWNPLKER